MTALERLFVTVPYFKAYLQTLRAPPGRLKLTAYTIAKRGMGRHIGWDAEEENLAHLSEEDREWVTSPHAYETMIKALSDRMGV